MKRNEQGPSLTESSSGTLVNIGQESWLSSRGSCVLLAQSFKEQPILNDGSWGVSKLGRKDTVSVGFQKLLTG
jgi:hypothetical protein